VSAALTSNQRIDLVVTEPAVIGLAPDGGASLPEIASSVAVKEAVAATEPTLRIPDKVAEMLP
jgi:acyl CoA:acetate/3-ketoacid CoA transferase beta subunit